ncbi:AraC-like DNA-binding protein [Lewinella marina]|nr:nickel-binding protein [Neolewinella marina]NJB87124.1 AraC-like DNA-binding protein [Neolewinella marina]
MDIHIIDSEQLLAEEVARAHVQDLKVEKRHGVRQLKYWVDTTNKKVFCLLRGPSAAACHAVHEEAHGMTACNIVELTEDGSGGLLFGDRLDDLAYTGADPGLDSGFRTLLRLDTFRCDNGTKNALAQDIVQRGGHLLPRSGDHYLAWFTSCADALRCAQAIKNAFTASPTSGEYQIGLRTGRFLDRHSNYQYEAASRTLQCLALLGMPDRTFMDKETFLFFRRQAGDTATEALTATSLSEDDFKFLARALSTVEREVVFPSLTVDRFNRLLGMSKASVYRAVKSLVGISPGRLIKFIRLRRALQLLTEDYLTISEVAYAVGFSSPSYFSRAFKARYGHSPSTFSVTHQ